MAEQETSQQMDTRLAIEAARFAGLTGSQGPGLAELFALVRRDERERVLKRIETASVGRPTIPWLHNALMEMWRELRAEGAAKP